MYRQLPLFIAICGATSTLYSSDTFEPFDREYSAKAQEYIESNEKKPYYIKYKAGKIGQLESSMRLLGGDVNERLPDNRVIVTMLTRLQVKELQNSSHMQNGDGAIEYIEPVPREKMLGSDITPFNVKQVQALDLWDVNRDGYVDSDASAGKGIKVCIIDSGLDGKHDEFKPLIDAGKVTGTSLVAGRWDEDDSSHGTHVAGSILAQENNRGVLGVAPKVESLHIVRYFGPDGSASLSGLATAIKSCETAKADVVNMSLGGGGASQTNKDAFQGAYDAGMLLIAAAGNDGNDVASYPASYDTIISVGALKEDEEAIYFSQTPPTKLDPNHQDLVNLKWDTVELSGGGYKVLSSVPYPNGEIPNVSLTIDGDDSFGVRVPNGALISKTAYTGELVYGDECVTPGNWSGKIVVCKRGENLTDKSEIFDQFKQSLQSAKSGGAVAVISYDAEPYKHKPNCDQNGLNVCPADLPVIFGYNSTGKKLVPELVDVGKQATINIHDGSLDCNTGPGTCQGGYSYMSGTSMASPTVAGAATLLWDMCGGPEKVSNRKIRHLLRLTAKDLVGRQQPDTSEGELGSDVIDYGVGYDRVTGWGLPQIADALSRAEELGITSCEKPKIQISPKTLSVCPNTPAKFDVNIASAQGVNEYKLSVSGQDLTATTTFTPASTQTSSILEIETGVSGSYDLLVSADNGASDERVIDASLTVLPESVDAPVLSAPFDNDDSVNIDGLLSWKAVSGAESYQVMIAKDSNFTKDLKTFTVAETSFKLGDADLQIAESYFWKIVPVSTCGGTTAASETRSFTIEAKVCLSPQAIIKNKSTERTVSSIDLNVDDARKIRGLSVDLDVNVYPVSGFVAELIHTDAKGEKTTLSLIDQPGIGPDSTEYAFGCYRRNVQVRLNDKANEFAENYCHDETPGLRGVLKPNQPLSVFTNEKLAGKWTLSVASLKDNSIISSLGENQLNRWCLAADINEPNKPNVNYDDKVVVGKVAYEAEVDTVIKNEAGSDLTVAANNAISYKLYSDSTSGAISLDTSGAKPYLKVKDKAQLQKSKSPATVVIIAEDSDGNVASVIVDIDIVGSPHVNKAPEFASAPYSVNIPYNANNGDSVIDLDVADPDKDNFTTRISSGNEKGIFELTAAHTILVKDNTTFSKSSTTPYVLTIEAKDVRGNTSEAVVTISLFDPDLLPDTTFCSSDEKVSIPKAGFSNPDEHSTSSLVITDSGFIESMTVDVKATIKSAGDLDVKLVNEAGKEVVLADSEDQELCFTNNVDVTFSDLSPKRYKDFCNGYNSSYGKEGELSPAKPLSLFKTKELKGEWKLKVSSSYSTGGTLDKWCINVKTSDSVSNYPPELTGAGKDFTLIEGELVSKDVNTFFTDKDGDTLTINVFGNLPAGLTLSKGIISGKLKENTAGDYPITIQANDGKGGTTSLAITITVSEVTNTPPELTGSGKDFTHQEGEIIEVDTTAYFRDADGDKLSFSTSSALPQGIQYIDGKLIGTLQLGSAGVYQLELIASDGKDEKALSLTWTVIEKPQNTIPELTKPAYVLTRPNEAVEIDVRTFFKDADGDELSVSLEGDLPRGVSLIDTSFKGATMKAGNYDFVIIVSDGNGGELRQTFAWDVKEASDTTPVENHPPKIVKSPFLTHNIGEAVSINVKSYFSDSDNHALTFSLEGDLPNKVYFDGEKLIGTLTKSGEYSFDIIAKDGHGGELRQTFNWEVLAEENTAPTATIKVLVLYNEVSENFSKNVSKDLLSIFSDKENDKLRIVADGVLPEKVTLENSVLIGKLEAKHIGSYQFNIIAYDDKGGSAKVLVKWLVGNSGVLFQSGFE